MNFEQTSRQTSRMIDNEILVIFLAALKVL